VLVGWLLEEAERRPTLATPDEGWCSGVFAFDVQQGNSEGVDLGGTKVVFIADWPGNFWDGGGTARLYIDAAASADQRRELEEVFGGKKSGFIADVWGAVIDSWLPAQTAKIDMGWDGNLSLPVNGLGQATLKPFVDAVSRPATISGAQAQTALHIESMNVASAKDSQWSDSGLHQWQADDGVIFEFNWNG
jgi:hypothetical protein